MSAYKHSWKLRESTSRDIKFSPSLLGKLGKMAEADSTHQVVASALSNPVILREIFKYSRVDALKSYALVNKLWNHECFSFMRDFRDCAVTIQSEMKLRNFEEHLGKMSIIPYNSINFSLSKCNCSGKLNSEENLQVKYHNVLTKMKLRRLKFKDDLRKVRYCSAAVLAAKLIREKGTGLESLQLKLFGLCGHFLGHEVPKLPKLTDIQLALIACDSNKVYVKRLLDCAPNIRRILGKFNTKKLGLLTEDKWCFIQDFQYLRNGFIDDRNHDVCAKLASTKPSLRRLFFRDVSKNTDNPPDELFFNLLQSSQWTLEELKIQTDSTKNVGFQIPPTRLERLNKIEMTVLCDPEILIEMLKSLQYDHFFPSLTVMSLEACHAAPFIEMPFNIVPHPRENNDELEREMIENGPSLICPCLTVSTLELHLDVSMISFVELNQIFPSVKDLGVRCHSDGATVLPYKQIFRLWQNLEGLRVDEGYGAVRYNCDAAFCGLNQEEVEVLWNKDDEYLESVQLVPTAPCVLTASKLKSLTIRFPTEEDEPGPKPCSRFVSKVTELIAFRRLPMLQANIRYPPAK